MSRVQAFGDFLITAAQHWGIESASRLSISSEPLPALRPHQEPVVRTGTPPPERVQHGGNERSRRAGQPEFAQPDGYERLRPMQAHKGRLRCPQLHQPH